MLTNSPKRYGLIAKLFHWIMAILFVGMFAVAYTMINMPSSPFRFTLYDLHKATGLLLLLLVTLRLQWRWMNHDPALPATTPRWQVIMANSNVVLLYVLMFIMPISGILTSTTGGHPIKFYGLFTINPLANNEQFSAFFSVAHDWLSWVLVALFTMHVLAALHHHFIVKDGVLKKML